MPLPPHQPQLTPASLFEDQARLDSLRLETYNRILMSIHQKIKFVAQKPEQYMTFFDVPEWQPGCPRYDVKDCILYLVWNLRHSGFKVVYMPYNRIVISWQEQIYKYYQEESPIKQAMQAVAAAPTPPTPKTEKKKTPAAYKPATEGVAGMLAAGGKTKGGKSGATITFI